jgi:NADPH2:quinone reductase
MPAEGVILGMEGSGVIEATGSAVTRFKAGDEVYYWDGGFIGTQGNYAQFKIVNEHYAARKPRSLSFPEAAVLPVVVITSWEALYDRARLESGDYLLVQGGAGGLGHIGVQLGKLRGAHVAATVSTQSKATIVQNLGADRAILYRDEDVAAAVQAWSGKDGADVVFDTVGDAVFGQSIDLLATYGRLVSAAYPSSWPKGDLFVPALKNVEIAFEAMGHALRSHELRVKQTRILEIAAQYVDEGRLRVVLDRVYPLSQAGEAQKSLESGEITGRLALEIPH